MITIFTLKQNRKLESLLQLKEGTTKQGSLLLPPSSFLLMAFAQTSKQVVNYATNG